MKGEICKSQLNFLEDNITDKITTKSNKMNIQEISQKIFLLQKIREKQKILLPISKQMNAPISKHQILSFEERYKVSLPRDYKEFISNIGNGGIGPDYGLLPLQDSIVDTKIKNSPQIDISTPFAFTNSWNESWIMGLDWENGERPTDKQLNDYMDVRHISGCLQIGHIGHGCTYLLVINGEDYGTIWTDERADYGGLNPVLSECGQKMMFEKWYMDWLDNELQQCSKFSEDIKP